MRQIAGGWLTAAHASTIRAPAFREHRSEAGRLLLYYVQEEFEYYLKFGRLEEGFLRVRCEHRHAGKLVALFSCKKRGFCPSCGARCMAETAALLFDEVLPECLLRQRLLPLPLRFLLATDPQALTLVLGMVNRNVSRHLIGKAGFGECALAFMSWAGRGGLRGAGRGFSGRPAA